MSSLVLTGFVLAVQYPIYQRELIVDKQVVESILLLKKPIQNYLETQKEKHKPKPMHFYQTPTHLEQVVPL